jgi:hypothetical protein
MFRGRVVQDRLTDVFRSELCVVMVQHRPSVRSVFHVTSLRRPELLFRAVVFRISRLAAPKGAEKGRSTF